MNRTIRLTRIHALNWYGYQDSIQVEGNLLLAGVTGSGKSILMDLIQLVLVGDQRMVRFNQSATGDRSDRSLKGYCLGDTKQEENGVTQYMRQSAITYVALEFTWPNKKKVETWGFRVEFASPAEAQGKVTPFFVPAAFSRSDFLDAEKRPLDYTAFKAVVESQKGRLYADGIEAYLRDMSQPVHLNFDRSVLRSLLPTAMSFTFLRSFNEFCRQFILPADKLDISDVTASYRTFLAYERDLGELNDQLTRLRSIHCTFERLAGLQRDRAVARYLEAELRHEHAVDQLKIEEQKLARLREDCSTEDKRLAELEEKIPALHTRIDGIKSAVNETPEGLLYNELKSQTAKLSREVARLSEIGITLDQALSSRVKRAAQWIEEVRSLPLDLDSSALQLADRAIKAVEQCGVERAADTLQALSNAAQRIAAEVSRAASPIHKRISEIRNELGQLRESIAALRVGKLPFPTRLLDALNNSLMSRGSDLAAQPLCKLCEITDERWRPAIEVAFTRKFAIVVSQENYPTAEKLYHNLKQSDLGAEAARESLINPVKALKIKKGAQPGSLAEKIKTSDPVAEAIINQLFGDLVCVESREELSRHDYAIMCDGFMTRGPFVERPRFYDGNPFVGKRGLEQQLAWKEKQRDELDIQERKLRPLIDAVQRVNDAWREQFEIPPSLYKDLAEAQQLPKVQDTLEETIARLNQIDRAKFDDLAKQQAACEHELKLLEDERRILDRSEKRAELRRKESEMEYRRQETSKLRLKFETVRNETDVSKWLKRMDELRKEMFARFPAKDAAADEFTSHHYRCDRDAAAAWEELKSLRRELGITHNKYQDLPIEEPANESYDKQLARLEESDIPDYHAKAERERRNWENLFRTQILEKLHTALQSVRDLIVLLNNALKNPIGNNRYQIRAWQNPDFRLYHELIETSSLARADELFFASAEPRFRDAIQHFLRVLTEQPDGIEATRLLDYRHYYEYDMEVSDITHPEVRSSSVDKHSGKFSGGENQSPYFIAILASYLRAYRRYISRKSDPTLGLVPIDEAFSKLSGERIKDCITALKSLDLQGVFSMSTGNIPYALEHCDWLVGVMKEERRNGKKTEIRNIPFSVARDSEDAQRLIGD